MEDKPTDDKTLIVLRKLRPRTILLLLSTVAIGCILGHFISRLLG
jgi:hypothetical protein